MNVAGNEGDYAEQYHTGAEPRSDSGSDPGRPPQVALCVPEDGPEHPAPVEGERWQEIEKAEENVDVRQVGEDRVNRKRRARTRWYKKIRKKIPARTKLETGPARAMKNSTPGLCGSSVISETPPKMKRVMPLMGRP